MSGDALGRKWRSRWELYAESTDQEPPVSGNSPLSESHEWDGKDSPPKKRRCRWEYEVSPQETVMPSTMTAMKQESSPKLNSAPAHREHMTQNCIAKDFHSIHESTGDFDNGNENDEVQNAQCLVSNDDAQKTPIHFLHTRDGDRLCSPSLPSSSIRHSGLESDSESIGDFLNEESLVEGRLSTCASEFKRLSSFLYTSELASVPQRTVEKLISIDPIRASVSYRNMAAFAQRTSMAQNSFDYMCPEGHCVARGRLKSSRSCPVCKKPMKGIGSSKFWYMEPSSAIRELCRAKESFEELKRGWDRVRNSVEASECEEGYYDYYHSRMFRRNYSSFLNRCNSNPDETLVFLTLSTDGFECARDRRGNSISSWPVVSTILNYSPKERARANNALVFAIVPGSHSSNYFDTFLQMLIEDFRLLEKVISVLFHDNRIRLIRVYVTYFTADWPAASKVLGYVGHTGNFFCRFCLRRKEYVSECKSSYIIPRIPKQIMLSLIHPQRSGVARYRPGDVISIECVPERSSVDILSTWKSLRHGADGRINTKSITKVTGIKADCSLRKLSMNHKYSHAYDVMHLVLIGWTKHVAKLLCGFHNNHSQSPQLPKYCIPGSVLNRINTHIERAPSGIPVCWGRAPLPLSEISKYKAEDLKRLAEMYFLPYLHRFNMSRNKIKLWLLTSRMVSVSFNYRCDVDAVLDLQRVVEELYVRLFQEFYTGASDAFCFTPSTHAILHLPDLLKECGPLPVTSQFLIERLLGDMGRRMTSRTNVNSHLFHKNHRLFTLRIMSGGLAPRISEEATLILENNRNQSLSERTADSNSEHEEMTGIKFQGHGKLEKGWSAFNAIVAKFVRENFSENASLSRIRTVKQFHSALITTSTSKFTVETQKRFQDRCRLRTDARQKFSVAAEFERNREERDEYEESPHSDSKRDDKRMSVDLYYGDVQKMFEVELEIAHENVNRIVHAAFLEVRWHYGWVYDEYLDLLYTKDRRRSEITIEPSNCLKRPIGFLEISRRRYFLDRVRREHVLGPRRVQMPFVDFKM